MKIQYLGTGGGAGIPEMFCSCRVCENARRQRGAELRSRSMAIIDDVLGIDLPCDARSSILEHGINAMRIRHLLVTHNHYDHFLADNLISRPQGAFPVSVYISEASGNALAQKCEKIRAKPGVTGLRPICCPDVTFVEPFHSFRCGEYTAVPLAANHDPSVGSLNFLIKSGTKAILWLHDTGPLPQSTLAFLRGLGQYISFISMDCALAEGKCYSDDHMDILRCGETVRLLRQCGCVDDNTVVCLSHIGHLVECTHQELVDRAGQFGFKVAHDGMEVYV